MDEWRCPICKGSYDGNGDCPNYHDNDDVIAWRERQIKDSQYEEMEQGF